MEGAGHRAGHAPARRSRRSGIIGAGTMGGGIAMNFATAGIPVRLSKRHKRRWTAV